MKTFYFLGELSLFFATVCTESRYKHAKKKIIYSKYTFTYQTCGVAKLHIVSYQADRSEVRLVLKSLAVYRYVQNTFSVFF